VDLPLRRRPPCSARGSAPTASGLHWQHGGGPDSTAFVPDICSPDSFPTAAAAAAGAKRQRNR